MSISLRKIAIVGLFFMGLSLSGYYFFAKNCKYNEALDKELVYAVRELEEALGDVVQENQNIESHEPEHFPVYPERDISRTREEILAVFKDLGISYCNKTLITYGPALDRNARNCEKYKQNKEFYDQLSALYADDVAAQKLAPISLRWLGGEIGHGVFAESKIAEGDFIGIYGGAVQDKESVANKDYAWSYPTETINDLPVDGVNLSLDAHYVGNEMRFVNDGINPNCIVRYVIGHDNYWHVCYTALRDIAQEEQLLVSYGKAYWDTRKYKYQALSEGQ